MAGQKKKIMCWRKKSAGLRSFCRNFQGQETESNVSSLDGERIAPREGLPGEAAFISDGYKETLSNIDQGFSPCWTKNVLKTEVSELRDQ